MSSLSLSAQLVKSRYPAHKSLLQAATKASKMKKCLATSRDLWVEMCTEFRERHTLKVFKSSLLK